MQSINEIKEILKNTDVTALSEFIKHYNTDERSGVKKLVLKAEKEIEAYNKEVARTENLKFFENKYSDYNYICGIDEVEVLYSPTNLILMQPTPIKHVPKCHPHIRERERERLENINDKSLM